MSSSLSQPSGVTASKPAVVTESITKTTFTETTVKRVTAAAVIEQVTSIPSWSRSERCANNHYYGQVALRRSGGPLGLSIIGGSDHSCVPFGTGEQVSKKLAVLLRGFVSEWRVGGIQILFCYGELRIFMNIVCLCESIKIAGWLEGS